MRSPEEAIGRGQLKLPIQDLGNSKAALRQIRNVLAGQAVGLTRDESLLEEVLKCAFCRVYLERTGEARLWHEDVGPEEVSREYRWAFSRIRQKFPGLFGADVEILLGPGHVAYIDREFARLDLTSSGHDIVGDIYETFIGSSFRGQEGQFFTPRTAVRALVELTEPSSDDLIVDPACGSGAFLLQAAARIRGSGAVLPERIHGVEKDAYLVRLSQLHLALQFDCLFPVNCADSLLWDGNGFQESPTKEMLGQFSLVLTNPPFGSKIVALAGDTRRAFHLAHNWRFSKRTGRFEEQSSMAENTPPQVLFVERCVSLLAPGGRLGIVLPESVLSSPKYRYVVQYILDVMTPVAVVGMPESLFKTSGRSGTHTKVCLVVFERRAMRPDDCVFMAEALWCGHDSRAREIPRDDVPEIVSKFQAFRRGETITADRFGFLVSCGSLQSSVLAPRFHDPGPGVMVSGLELSHDLRKVSELVEAGFVSISTGDEIGKLAYGTGEIPFVRTSDLSNWEIKVDPKHGVSREVYEQYAPRQDVREGDILMVRDGTYLIGTCAFVSSRDTKMVYQSHLLKFRVNPGAPFDNYLLLAILSSPPVVAQIKALSFTQDIIDSLGNRVLDLVLPIPRSEERRRAVSEMVRRAINRRIEARELIREARQVVAASE